MLRMSARAVCGGIAAAGILTLYTPAGAQPSIGGYTLTASPRSFAPGSPNVTVELVVPAFAGLGNHRYVEWAVSQGGVAIGGVSQPAEIPNSSTTPIILGHLAIPNKRDRIVVTAKVGFGASAQQARFDSNLSKLSLPFIYACNLPKNLQPCAFLPTEAYALIEAARKPLVH